MKKKLLAVALLAGGSMFAQTRFSVGVNVGGNSRGYYSQGPPAYTSVIPPCPGPGYTWVNGYWVPPAYENGYQTQRFNRGYEYNARRGFDRDDHRVRAFDRDRDHDDRDRDPNGFSRGFRNR